MKNIKHFLTILLTFFLLSMYFTPFVFAKAEEPTVTAEAAILVDNYTGSILFSKNIDNKQYPASTTKILTAILAIENCKLSDTAIASSNAITSVPSGYSVGAIQIGEELTIEQLLEVLLVHSANDAANVLGEHVGGSIEKFAEIMNNKANEIGCTNSHFVNPSGKHDDNHYTTARDLALIMQYCMKNDTFRRIASMRSCTLPATSKSVERQFATTVELLIPDDRNVPYNYYYKYAIAGKTGFTTEAKNCLVSVSQKDGLELTSVILGAGPTPEGYSSRFIETKAIYNYGFDNYSIKRIAKKDDIVKTLDVFMGTSETKNLDLIIYEDVNALVENDQVTSDVTKTITLMDNIQAPINQGDEIGTITYEINNIKYTTKLIASHSVEKSKTLSIALMIGGIILIILILILIFVLGKVKKNKKNKKVRNVKK